MNTSMSLNAIRRTAVYNFILLVLFVLLLFVIMVVVDERMSKQLDGVDLTYEEYQHALTVHGDKRVS